MKKIIFIIFLSFIINIVSFSLDTVSTKYYPLKVGYSWTYIHYVYFPPAQYRFRYTVNSTFVTNGHLYYSSTQGGVRVDSVSGNLVKTTNQGCNWLLNEYLIDSLASHKNDSSSSKCLLNSSFCNDTGLTNVFGYVKPYKKFLWTNFLEGWGCQIYIKDFGLDSLYESYLGHPDWSKLIGCVIDGIVYGDTTITSNNLNSTNIPNSYSLFQNFPNPFNPTTKIKYDIASSTKTKLVIFDILGCEVTTLVNEVLPPGTYESEWNGTIYASGVYFYKLQTESFTQTKKMVLLR